MVLESRSTQSANHEIRLKFYVRDSKVQPQPSMGNQNDCKRVLWWPKTIEADKTSGIQSPTWVHEIRVPQDVGWIIEDDWWDERDLLELCQESPLDWKIDQDERCQCNWSRGTAKTTYHLRRWWRSNLFWVLTVSCRLQFSNSWTIFPSKEWW